MSWSNACATFAPAGKLVSRPVPFSYALSKNWALKAFEPTGFVAQTNLFWVNGTFFAFMPQRRIVPFQSNLVLPLRNLVLCHRNVVLFHRNLFVFQSNVVMSHRNFVLFQSTIFLFQHSVVVLQNKGVLFQTKGVLPDCAIYRMGRRL